MSSNAGELIESIRHGSLSPDEKAAAVADIERRAERLAAIAAADMASHYPTDETVTDRWRLLLGDSCERLAEIEDESADLSIYSPPFGPLLYTYSPTSRDVGNCRDLPEFVDHYGFVIDHMLRITKPGRLSAVHIAQTVTQKGRDGYVGLVDLRGAVIAAHIARGWIYHGEITVQKNPQALRDGTLVLTPSGWCAVDRLVVGDCVIGSNGEATKVVAVPYKGRQPIYRVTFDDGATVECGPEHLWDVRTSTKNPWMTLRTDEIAQRGTRPPGGGYRYAIPVVPPVEMAGSWSMPVHPKLLGAILADGNSAGQRAVSICKDRELVEALPLPPGHTLSERPGSDRAGGRTASFGIVGVNGRNDVLLGLRQLGLEQCRAWEKFIPESYLLGSIDERRELLRGLLDGDGKISAKGAIYYQTTSPRLAAGVVELVNSLGGIATAREGAGSHYGDDKHGRNIWTVSVRLTGGWCPFSLQRKAQHWTPDRRKIHRWITDVELIGETDDVTCITVDAADGLFVTASHVLTHNSQAVRTKSVSLLFATLNRDSAMNRPALADYVVLFRKPGDNAVPIKPTDAGVTHEDWISWAHPIWPMAESDDGDVLDLGPLTCTWDGIRESATLNAAVAREGPDERHICPLQLPLIDRAVRLWSNPGEMVLSPFAGIGSEGYQSLLRGRRFTGIELKPSYYATACENLRRAEYEADLPSLFDAEG